MLLLPELMKSLFLDNLLFVVIWFGILAKSGTHFCSDSWSVVAHSVCYLSMWGLIPSDWDSSGLFG